MARTEAGRPIGPPPRTVVALALAMASASCRGSNGPVRLDFQFVPGEQYTYRYTSRWSGRVESPGQPPRTFTRNEESEIRRTVESFDPQTLVATLREITEAKAREWRIDATRSHSWTREMVLRIRHDGRVVGIDGLEQKDGFYGQRYFEKLFEQGLPVFPAEPILPGYTWKQSKPAPLPAGGTGMAEATFTFEGMSFLGKRRCAVISEVNHLIIPFEEEGQRGIDESQGKGRLYVDIEQGIPVREEIEREVQPKRWFLIRGKQILAPGRTVYHSVEKLDLISAKTHRPSGGT